MGDSMIRIHVPKQASQLPVNDMYNQQPQGFSPNPVTVAPQYILDCQQLKLLGLIQLKLMLSQSPPRNFQYTAVATYSAHLEEAVSTIGNPTSPRFHMEVPES